MTGKEISRIVAQKMKVTNPEDFALFSLRDGKGESCQFRHGIL
jgi:hypothetical protein